MPGPTNFPDGVSIGVEADVLPIYKFDEWVQNLPIGEMTAGEVRVVTIDETDLDPLVPTIEIGMTVLARPDSPAGPYNYDSLLIMGAWSGEANKISVRLKNLSSSTVDFGTEQWTFSYFRTFNL